VASRSFELLDVSGKLLLHLVEAIPGAPAQFIRKSPELFACFLRYEQSVRHVVVYSTKQQHAGRPIVFVSQKPLHCEGGIGDESRHS